MAGREHQELQKEEKQKKPTAVFGEVQKGVRWRSLGFMISLRAGATLCCDRRQRGLGLSTGHIPYVRDRGEAEL